MARQCRLGPEEGWKGANVHRLSHVKQTIRKNCLSLAEYGAAFGCLGRESVLFEAGFAVWLLATPG
jgi:hypothetical protein